MTLRFIHTADWQISKPFAGVIDHDKRSRLRAERIEAIKRIGALARDRKAAFVVVAGDLFDSPTADNSTIASACAAIGSIPVPVYAIPGNHDHGGPGTVWSREFFLREREKSAPNLTVLLEPKPVTVPGAVLLPCPLMRRQESSDTTAWLRNPEWQQDLDPALPRIMIAHGSVQEFTSASDDEESTGQSNRIDLSLIDPDAIDYAALGDWHGTRKLDDLDKKAWYSGTPELDRFPKGEDHDQGNVLLVDIPSRGSRPSVNTESTRGIAWYELNYKLNDDGDVSHLEQMVEARIGNLAGEALLKLNLKGKLGLAADMKLSEFIDRLEARLIRLKLVRDVQVLPGAEELATLSENAANPLIAQMTRELVAKAESNTEEKDVASLALRELYALVQPGRRS